MVSEFFETEEHGGVVLANGRSLTADVVMAADGVGTKWWAPAVGRREAAISSGFFIYRATFPVGPALSNPLLAKELAGFKDRGFLHVGPGAHMIISKSEADICWLLTPRDSDAGEESWARNASIDKALKTVEILVATCSATVIFRALF